MNAAPDEFSLRLAKLTDEELVWIAQCSHLQPPWQILMERFYDRVSRRIAQLAYHRLPDAEVPDAQQEASSLPGRRSGSTTWRKSGSLAGARSPRSCITA